MLDSRIEQVSTQLSLEGTKKLSFRLQDLLLDNLLIDKLSLDSNIATIHFKAPYNTKDIYQKFNRALVNLYKKNDVLPTLFKQPILSCNQPFLVLYTIPRKPKELNRILSSLIKEASQISRTQYKRILAKDKLIKALIVSRNQARIECCPPYDQLKYHHKINKFLQELYDCTPHLHTYFFRPQATHFLPTLELQDEFVRTAPTGEIIIQILVAAAKVYSTLQFSNLMKQGLLISGAQLQGNKVILIVKEDLNNTTGFQKINQGLQSLYNSSKYFNQYFEKPKRNLALPSLTLKKEGIDVFKTPQDILRALIYWANNQEYPLRNCSSNLAPVEKVNDQAPFILQDNRFPLPHHCNTVFPSPFAPLLKPTTDLDFSWGLPSFDAVAWGCLPIDNSKTLAPLLIQYPREKENNNSLAILAAIAADLLQTSSHPEKNKPLQKKIS